MVDSIRRAISKYSRQSDSSKKHLVLILDRHLQMFPWESIPSLQEKSVSRLPSLSFLTDRIQMLNNSSYGVLEIDHQASTSYVLNPSGDLKHTEKEFSLFLKR